MIAILGGLGAAVLWAAANLASSRSTRIIGATSTVAWMMVVGLVVATPFAVASGPLPTITPTLAVWLTASGVGGVVGLMLVYRGLRIGKVGVVLALASTEGAIAAVFAVVAGEKLTIPTTVVLGFIAIGVATVALASGSAAEPADGQGEGQVEGEREGEREGTRPGLGPQSGLGAERRAALFGAAAAIAFGFAIYGTARAGMSLPIAVAVLPARILGVAFVFLPMALAGRLRMTRRAVPMVVIVGLGEVLGNASYVVGARESIAIASVLASQFAAIAAVAAFLLFRERLSAGQRSGFVAIAAGVAILTIVRG
jgi:drug/metabolite transporter (DMT)-like permease